MGTGYLVAENLFFGNGRFVNDGEMRKITYKGKHLNPAEHDEGLSRQRDTHGSVFILRNKQDGTTVLCGPKIQKILAKPLHLGTFCFILLKLSV